MNKSKLGLEVILDKKRKLEIIKEISRQLINMYVFSDKAKDIERKFQQWRI